MTDYQVTYWRDLPSLVVAKEGETVTKGMLGPRFQEAIDEAAMRLGASDSDAYLGEWRKGEPYLVEGEAADVASGEAARLEEEFSSDAIKALIANEGWATPRP